jgi:hypothetical protein
VLALLAPGLRFMHEGQRSGRRLRASNHLRRRIPEPVDVELHDFYNRLLACVRRPDVRDGAWTLLGCSPAWADNPTWPRFIAYSWEGGGHRLLVAVNYGPTQGQCYVRLAFADLAGRGWRLRDLMHPRVEYDRAGDDLARQGLYLDLPAWGHHVFEVTPI